MGLEAPHEIEEQVAKQKISSAGFLEKKTLQALFNSSRLFVACCNQTTEYLKS
ncbi:MAG: Uncharacterised protein [Prochlorococcus marinus str. MIT 9215]|nr:MAG: Uncharacterised protein [Prochlorococcus marinus str. MIT 9215]